jgi:Ni/Co efflux regulator RcnB
MENRITKFAVILGFTVLSAASVLADKPASPGNSGAQNASKSGSSKSVDSQYRESSQDYFTEVRRAIIRDYYGNSLKTGKCPPGLAKKNNGCMPPGQLKKWKRGEILPRDVPYFDLPSAILNELGRTPEGEKLVQVGTDLLLISIATGRILDVFDIDG